MQFTPWDNPMGTDGFEFVEYAAPDPAGTGQAVRDKWASPRSPGTATRRSRCTARARSTSSSMPSRTRSHSASRGCTGPASARWPFASNDAARPTQRALELGAWGFDNQTGPMELNIPAIKGIGDSLIYFVDRWHGKGGAAPGAIGNISIYDVDFVPIAGADAATRRPRPDLHRPPDAQRAPRPHEGVGRLLRAAVQLQGSALLRHRGQADRAEEQGDDEPLRQDPHPDQRELRRQEPDRRVPGPVPRRRHPAHRARAPTTSTPPWTA